MVRMWCSRYYDGCRWWSGYYDCWTVGGQGTTMVGLGRSGYDDGLAAVVMVLRWLDCGGEGATMAGLQWRECYVGLSQVALELLRLG